MADLKKAVITVLGYDKKGIIAKVTDALYRYDANTLDITQTVISGLFNMMMVTDTTNCTVSAQQMAEDLKKAEQLLV
jgi:ACT domain-containing protein